MHLASLIKQKPNETIVYALRRHKITFLPTLGLFFILFLLPIALYFLILNMRADFLEIESWRAALILLTSVYYLSVLLFFFGNFIDFYLDLWIVTSERIVDIEQFGLFSRETSEAELNKIQDVTASVKGFFQTFFHFGDVTIRTASEASDIVFKQIPYPNKVRAELIRLSNESRKSHLSDQPTDLR